MSSGEITGFRVTRAGPLALLQDAGRFGVRHLGVTQGGPAACTAGRGPTGWPVTIGAHRHWKSPSAVSSYGRSAT